MKKLLGILLIFAMCLSFAACSEDKDNSKKDKQENTQTKPAEVKPEDTTPAKGIVLNEQFEVDGYAKLTLKSVTTTNSVKASMGSFMEYKVDNEGNLYADVVFDIEYLGENEVMCNEFMVATATGKSGNNYEGTEDILYCVEKNNLTDIASYEAIVPLSSVRFHVAVEVPETEESVTIEFKINGEKYSFDYKIGDDIRDASPLMAGSVLEEAEFASVEFLGAKFADEVSPSNGAAGSVYYTPDSEDNTYLVAEFNITNYQSEENDSSSFIGISTIFDGKYKYTGFMAVENADGTTLSSTDVIAPNETRRVLCVIEVPKTVEGMDYNINILFNKNDYAFSDVATFEADIPEETESEETDKDAEDDKNEDKEE